MDRAFIKETAARMGNKQEFLRCAKDHGPVKLDQDASGLLLRDCEGAVIGCFNGELGQVCGEMLAEFFNALWACGGEVPELSSDDLKGVIQRMRQLHRVGVRNFVVTDELYESFRVQQEERDKDLGASTGALEFRGEPILRQCDVESILNQKASSGR